MTLSPSSLVAEVEARSALAALVRPPAPPSGGAPLVEARSGAELVQRAGAPLHVLRAVYGGPAGARDVRCVLSRLALVALLDACAASPSGRARCDGAALLVDVLRGTDGHVFEVWTPLAARISPEPVALTGDADLPDLDLDAELLDLAGRSPAETRDAIPGLPSRAFSGSALVRRSLWAPRPELRPRWLLDSAGLRRALNSALASLSGRAVLNGVGVSLSVYLPQATRAPPYEVWTLLADGAPRPETAST